jgi:hypothetical protein
MHRKHRAEFIGSDDGQTPLPTDASNAQVQRLKSILLGYLHSAHFPACPGADGLTLDDAISGYPHAAVLGLVPSFSDLHKLHPDLADALPRLFPTRQRGEK